MKLLTLITLFALPIATYSQSARVEVLIVQLPEARAIELLPKLRGKESCAAAQKEIVTMLGKDAELVDWPIINTRSGQATNIENVETISHPTEFSQPIVFLDQSEDGGAKPAQPSKDGEPTKPGKTAEAAIRIAAAVPSSFEASNVGVSISVEPQFGTDAKTLHMNFSFSHKTLLGWQKYVLEAAPEYKVTVERPRFYEIKTSNNYSLSDGESVLVAFSKLSEPKGKIEIAILSAHFVPEVRSRAKEK